MFKARSVPWWRVRESQLAQGCQPHAKQLISPGDHLFGPCKENVRKYFVPLFWVYQWHWGLQDYTRHARDLIWALVSSSPGSSEPAQGRDLTAPHLLGSCSASILALSSILSRDTSCRLSSSSLVRTWWLTKSSSWLSFPLCQGTGPPVQPQWGSRLSLPALEASMGICPSAAYPDHLVPETTTW